VIDITGLDKADVLIALYESARVQGFGYLHVQAEPLSRDVARELLARQTYFDYLFGRVLKVDFAEEDAAIDPRLYDRDNGEGAAQRAIETLRVKQEKG
jgi:hypothetical protein